MIRKLIYGLLLLATYLLLIYSHIKAKEAERNANVAQMKAQFVEKEKKHMVSLLENKIGLLQVRIDSMRLEVADCLEASGD